ncbi:MAG TPA: hypothetical protein VLG44_03055 [Chlamydiales bacterium]|nr:hypothetical protein [Chlamydiales bacterium]
MTLPAAGSRSQSPVFYHQPPDRNINELDGDDCSELYHAVQAGNEPKVRKLLSAGASIYAGSSPLPVAINNVRILLLLLGIDHFPNLQRCTNFHEVCSVLFHIKDPLACLPLIGEHIKGTEALDAFELGMRNTEKNPLDLNSLMEAIVTKRKVAKPVFSTDENRRNFFEAQSLQAPITIIREVLIETCPLYKLLWECANKPGQLKLFDPKEGEFGKSYSTIDHSVTFGPHKTFISLLRSLIHGTFDALLHDTLIYLLDTPIHREFFTVIRTFLDHQTTQYLNRLFVILFNDKKAEVQSFKAYWNNSERFGKTAIYRHLWDRLFFCDYVTTYKGFYL